MDSPSPSSDPLTIGGRQFNSRLFTGTGKYPSMALMQQSIERSGCDMVTVAVRRVQTVAAGHEGLMEAIDWKRIWICLLYTSPSPRDRQKSRMPSSA